MTESVASMVIRDAAAPDAAAMASIYNHYVLNSTITFEEQAISAEEMTARIAEVNTAGLPWLVAEHAGRIVGYAYASKWKGRCAYRFSVETTVYLEQNATGHGIGTKLYAALFERLRQAGMHAAIGGVALPNAASVALHEKCGMRKVAQFEQVGFKFNRWIDVGYWQRVL
jgi:phosphinothricin acetyltransferase